MNGLDDPCFETDDAGSASYLFSGERSPHCVRFCARLKV
jgi:hypothetical protein